MADVPLTLAVVSTVSPVVAGALPLVIGWVRDAGRDKRESARWLATERLRLMEEKRGECVTLLKLARNYRVLVEDADDSSGADLAAYAKQIRQFAADIAGQADEVVVMVPAAGAAAISLATEARALADVTADRKNRVRGEALVAPDFTRFDRSLAEFRTAALAAFEDRPSVTKGSAAAAENVPRQRLQGTGAAAQERLALAAEDSSAVPGQLPG